MCVDLVQVSVLCSSPTPRRCTPAPRPGSTSAAYFRWANHLPPPMPTLLFAMNQYGIRRLKADRGAEVEVVFIYGQAASGKLTGRRLVADVPACPSATITWSSMRSARCFLSDQSRSSAYASTFGFRSSRRRRGWAGL